MYKIEKVLIKSFWGDKTVTLNFKEDVNFLIGVNGSGKTTIINLIAASLSADFSTLDRIQFKTIHIALKNTSDKKHGKGSSFIEVQKTEKRNSPFQNISFKIKRESDKKPKVYSLAELEEQQIIRHWTPHNIIYRPKHGSHIGSLERDVNFALKELVNVSWLSIHRVSNISRKPEERGFESTIDRKIKDLSNDFVKYFSFLNARHAIETEKFQKYIFESMIGIESQEDTLSSVRSLNLKKETASLKEIFSLLDLNESAISTRLESFFKSAILSIKKLDKREIKLTFKDVSYLLGTQRIHSVVKEWNKLIDTQNRINKPRETFLEITNNLLQRKKLLINEKNELTAETDNKQPLSLQSLSSGEKQLLIILGQSLLQESQTHIYIADEPELSLHIEWQEKLVSSLKGINPQSQIIFATHSPDIVGAYSNSVIDVETAIV
jgi:predicted ATPase